jgi:DNA-binding beta-propeller fold protein YncE
MLMLRQKVRGPASWGVFALAIAAMMSLASCGHEAGVIFPLTDNAPRWPAAPETARIRYVGQLSGSADLKAPVSAMNGLGAALFGSTPGESMQTPLAVCTDAGARVFVADTTLKVVHVFDLNSRAYAKWTPAGQAFKSPVGLAYDDIGHRLFVSDSEARTIYIFDSAGKFTGELAPGQFARPCGLAIDAPGGRIFVADVGAHQVVVVSMDGAVLQRIGSRGEALGQFNYPTNVALDRKGRLYVSDSLNFRVQQFGADLKPIRQIGKQGDMPGYFAQPKGIAVDPDGHVYVIDSQFEAMQIFDDTGALLLDVGEQGNGPGEFWLPSGIFIDTHGRIWIADSFNHRVQVMDYLPEGQQ